MLSISRWWKVIRPGKLCRWLCGIRTPAARSAPQANAQWGLLTQARRLIAERDAALDRCESIRRERDASRAVNDQLQRIIEQANIELTRKPLTLAVPEAGTTLVVATHTLAIGLHTDHGPVFARFQARSRSALGAVLERMTFLPYPAAVAQIPSIIVVPQAHVVQGGAKDAN